MGSPDGLSNKLVVSGCDQKGGARTAGGLVRHWESATPLGQEPVADDCSCMMIQITFRGEAIARCGVRSI